MIKEAEVYKSMTPKARRAESHLCQVIRRMKERYPHLAYALQIFQLQAVKTPLKIATDGLRLFYDPDFILKFADSKYDESEFWKNVIDHRIMHIAYHGLLGHFTEAENYRFKKLIGRVMDNQVERLANERRSSDLKGCGPFTQLEMEEISSYGYYYKMIRSPVARQRYKKPFEADDHGYWMRSRKEIEGERQQTGGQVPAQEDQRAEEAFRAKVKELWDNAWFFLTGERNRGEDGGVWLLTKQVYGSDRRYGKARGGLAMTKEKAGGEAEDYRAFIRRFMELREVSKEEDSLDPILYSYGLKLYGDVPLVEPLEQSDIRLLHHIYIAIDTSGSCMDVIPDFMRELEAIFAEVKQAGSVEGIHLLQADAAIQQEEVFTDLSDFRDVSVPSQWQGFGGTSFVEPIEAAQKLEAEGERVDLFLYLSDGEGRFPDQEPDFPVYFIIPGYNRDSMEEADHYHLPVPAWVKILNMERSSK